MRQVIVAAIALLVGLAPAASFARPRKPPPHHPHTGFNARAHGFVVPMLVLQRHRRCTDEERRRVREGRSDKNCP